MVWDHWLWDEAKFDEEELLSIMSPFAPEWGLLVEIDLDSGRRYYSYSGMATPSGWHEDLLLSVSSVRREIPCLPGEYTIADSEVVLNNAAGDFSALKAVEHWRGRPVRYLFGNLNAGYAAMTVLYTGRIVNTDLESNTRFRLMVRDASFDRFRLNVEGRISRIIFTDLPAHQELVLAPIIYGEVSSTEESATGVVPCYPVTQSTPFRFLVARHKCKSVLAVYVYGVFQSSGYTVTETVIENETWTFIDFTNNPQDEDRPYEICVTADVHGKMDDEGILIENPITQLQDFLLNYADVLSGELDADAFDDGEAKSNEVEYKGSVWIGGDDLVRADVISNFCQSFLMSFFVNREGLFSVSVIIANDLFADPGELPNLTDESEILRDTLRVESNPEVASQSYGSHYYQWAQEFYERRPLQINEGEDNNLGQAISAYNQMPYARSLMTACKVEAARLLFMTENQQFASFVLPPEFYFLDLGNLVSVTHFRGVGENGFQNAIFRILQLEIHLRPQAMAVMCRAVRILPGDPAHCDSHVDMHTDSAHGDAEHSDAAHGDAAHSDIAHIDISHSDVEHEDSEHTDSHSDVPHTDFHSDQAHADSHTDAEHADSHTDTPHEDTYTDVPHVDIHSDVSHEDLHTDELHGDAHIDTHTDAPHGDWHTDSHCDVEQHLDIEHGDVHCDHTDGGYLDYHNDSYESEYEWPHEDAYIDDHEDTEHGDVEHVDSHTDTEYIDTHTDVQHEDSHSDNIEHTDSYSDVPHADSHDDGAHADTHGDSPHYDDHDDVSHVDDYYDAAHGDLGHSDIPYSDTAHADSHSDSAHSDTSHQDSEYTDSLHYDFHCDTENPYVDGEHTDVCAPDIEMLFHYVAGDSLIEATYGRSGAARYMNSALVIVEAGDGVARDSHHPFQGVRTILLEEARENAWAYSENFATGWTTVGCSVGTDVVSAPDGSSTADDIVEDSSTAPHAIWAYWPSVSDNKPQAVSVFLKAGTRGFACLRSVNKADQILDVFVNLSTGALTYVSAGITSAKAVRYTSGWYRLEVVFPSSSGATTPVIAIAAAISGTPPYEYTGSTDVHAISMWGMQFEVDKPAPSSYIPTADSAASRNADSLSLPFTAVPQAMTLYAKFIERGAAALGAGVIWIGNAGATGPRTGFYPSEGKYQIWHYNGTAYVSSTMTIAPSQNDIVELRGVFYGDGSVQLFQTLNGGEEVEATASAANAPAIQWEDNLIWLNSAGTGFVGCGAFSKAKVAASIQSLARMRTF